MAGSKRHDLIINTSVVVTIVALGVVAAGLAPRQSDSTSAESTSSQPSSLIQEPVDPSADIPGCDEVESLPDDESRISVMTLGSDVTYDDPDHPWMTPGKASFMSDAVLDALPGGVDVALAAPSRSLVFQPVEDFGVAAAEGFPATSSAYGTLVRSGRSASLTVSVASTETAVPPCIAGALDARDVRPDGTTVDVLDTWYEVDGARTYVRSSVAYHADGTEVRAQESGGADSLPLQADELTRIASLPALRTTSAAPAGTPAPREDCSVPASFARGVEPDVARETLDAANAAVTATWSSIADAPLLTRPIGSLVPADFGSGVCGTFDVVGTPIQLSVTISGNQPLPVAKDPYDPESAYGPVTEVRTLPDGSVLEIVDMDQVATTITDDGSYVLSRSVTSTRPSGVQVQARSTVTAPQAIPGDLSARRAEPLPLTLLDAMARTPIESWP